MDGDQQAVAEFEFDFFNIPGEGPLDSHFVAPREDEFFSRWKGSRLAATYIYQGRYEDIEPFVERMIEQHPDCIQSWLNKKKLLERQQQPVPELVTTTITRLIHTPEALEEAKFLYTYWLSYLTQERTAMLRVREIFQALTSNNETPEDQRLKYCTFYVKALFRQGRNLASIATQATLEMLLHDIIDWLIFVANTATSDKMNCFAAIWYGKVLDAGWVKRCGSREQLIARFPNAVQKLYAESLHSCLRYVFESVDKNPGLLNSTNTIGQGGLLMRRYATGLEAEDTRSMWLSHAYRLCESYETRGRGNADFLPAECATIRLCQWAIEYHNRMSHIVRPAYRDHYGCYPNDLKRIWEYLANEYYIHGENGACPDDLKCYLEDAKRHLVKEKTQNGRRVPLQLPRVMSLLGEPVDKVEQEFSMALSTARNHFRETVLRHQEWFNRATRLAANP